MRKVATRQLKRKLVFELGSGCESQGDIPTEYSNNRLKWICDVSVEMGDCTVEEYSITPDRKLYLNDFLDIIKAEIVKIMDGPGVSWGIKIFRIVSKKR